MSDIKSQLKELIDLGQKWIDFARNSSDAYAWNYARSNDKCEVGCYFALNSDHTAVQFGNIQIGYHSTPSLEITLSALDNLDIKIKDYKQLLATERLKEAKMSEQKLNAEKKARKEYLERELKRLDKDLL